MVSEPLAEADEFVVEDGAAELGVEDGGGVDELGCLFHLAGVEIGQGECIACVEPGKGAGCIVFHSQAGNIDGERVDFEPIVGVAEVAEQPLALGELIEVFPCRDREPGFAIGAGEEQGAGLANRQLAALEGGQIFVAFQDGLDDELQYEPEPALAEVGVGGRGAAVEKADGIEQCAEFGGCSPRRMAVSFSLGLDVSAHFDQGDQAQAAWRDTDGRDRRAAG